MFIHQIPIYKRIKTKQHIYPWPGPREINIGIYWCQIPESTFGIHGGNTKPCHCLCLVFLQKRQSSGLCKAKRSFLDGIQKAPKKSPILEDYSAMAFISGRPQLSLTSRSISGNLSFLVKPAASILLTALVLGYYNFCIQIRKHKHSFYLWNIPSQNILSSIWQLFEWIRK